MLNKTSGVTHLSEEMVVYTVLQENITKYDEVNTFWYKIAWYSVHPANNLLLSKIF